VWRVLSRAGVLRKWNQKSSKKGTGFEQPPQPHQRWHIDVSYINIAGTFYYLCSVLDGFSRSILHWNLRGSMTEADIEIILQAAKQKHPEARPRIISDNGPPIYRQGLQRIHPHLGHDARQDIALLSAIERENRALAQIAQGRMYSARDAAHAGGCAPRTLSRLRDEVTEKLFCGSTGGVSTTSNVTGARPPSIIPNWAAAAWERSMIRDFTNGPRSLIRTNTLASLSRRRTRTLVPKGSVRCAAVNFSWS
jgi:transposase-like protein